MAFLHKFICNLEKRSRDHNNWFDCFNIIGCESYPAVLRDYP